MSAQRGCRNRRRSRWRRPAATRQRPWAANASRGLSASRAQGARAPPTAMASNTHTHTHFRLHRAYGVAASIRRPSRPSAVQSSVARPNGARANGTRSGAPSASAPVPPTNASERRSTGPSNAAASPEQRRSRAALPADPSGALHVSNVRELGRHCTESFLPLTSCRHGPCEAPIIPRARKPPHQHPSTTSRLSASPPLPLACLNHPNQPRRPRARLALAPRKPRTQARCAPHLNFGARALRGQWADAPRSSRCPAAPDLVLVPSVHQRRHRPWRRAVV